MQDFELQQQLAEQRRRQYAQQLQGAQQMPQGRMVGRHFVAPNALEYAAQALRGFGGMRGQDIADQELKDLSSQRQKATVEALRGFGEAAQGRPADQLAEGMAGPVRPAQAPDMNAAYAQLMQAPDAALRQAGMQGIIQAPQLAAQAEERATAMDFKRQEAEAARAARMEQLQMAHQQRLDLMQAQNASREQMAEEQRNFAREMAKMRQSASGGQSYFQFIGTPQGIAVGNARTGELALGQINGQPVVRASDDPTLQGAIAGAKTGATTEAKTRTESRLEAPKVIAQGEDTIRLVDDLLKAPGFKQAVGASRLLGVQKIPGTAARDFDIRLDQLQGQQFLQAFESLKGGGAITEVEGKKATDAIARMNAAGSEDEFTKAAREFQSVIRTGVERSRRAQGAQPATQAPAAQRPRVRFDAQGNVIP